MQGINHESTSHTAKNQRIKALGLQRLPNSKVNSSMVYKQEKEFKNPLGVITELDSNEVEQCLVKELIHKKRDQRERIELEIQLLFQKLHELKELHQLIYEKQIAGLKHD